MTVRRLRPKYTDEQLATVYSQQYDHTRWLDHVQRIEFSRAFIGEMIQVHKIRSIADLSCGDGAIVNGVKHLVDEVILGDFTPGHEYHGKIEDTILQIPPVDLFVLSETLEHINSPLSLLKVIRVVANHIFISTPLDEQDDGNPEHYWGWDKEGVSGLLADAGWSVNKSYVFSPFMENIYYQYQMWSAS